jgi:hypothetical protein
MKDRAAVSLGRRGGRKTAERGPEYYRKISALRKTKAGGRPRKKRPVTPLQS